MGNSANSEGDKVDLTKDQRYYRNHRERRLAESIEYNKSHLAYTGFGLDDYREMYREQGGKCAICDRKCTNLDVDHDHSHCPGNRGCKKCVRKLLCRQCNSGLGMFGDSIELLGKAAEYVRAHQRTTDPD